MMYQRINVIGTSGSGKSTFSKQLSDITGYPHIQIDALFWKPNWEPSDDQEFLPLLESTLEQESWILDGNYQKTAPVKWKNVEAVIWLDYSYPLTFYRILKRTIKRSFTREKLWGTNNREQFMKGFFSRESIIWWMMKTHSPYRKEYSLIMEVPEYAHIHFIRLKSPKEAQQFLDDLRNDVSVLSAQQ